MTLGQVRVCGMDGNCLQCCNMTHYPVVHINSSLHAHMHTGTWSSPPVSGTRPPPCSYFSLTKTDDYHLVMFGGKQGDVRTNDVYVLDFIRMVS